jgi:hypothetical protein
LLNVKEKYMLSMNMLNNLIKAVVLLLLLVLGVSIVYALIHLFNQVLYQILVHPLRTLLIIAGIWAIYGIGYILTKPSGKTNL